LRDEPNYRAAFNVSFRTGGAEEHDLWTDEIRVVSGEIDFVTGGTIEGRHPGGADGEFRGTALTGATVTRRLRAGDIVEVPAGTPHWTKVVKTPVTTFVYKVR
jgi:mannose-6-phosphate isomerase-like protein (cupin superfamily)